MGGVHEPRRQPCFRLGPIAGRQLDRRNARTGECAKSRNVGLCKLKLKRFGGLDALKLALEKVRECGMEPVLGDGVGIELGCWMEGCVARTTIRNAGEFNGFLKPKARLFADPLKFDAGALVLPSGFKPVIDRAVLLAHETACERHVAPSLVRAM